MKDIRPQLRDGDDQKAIIRKVNDFAEKLQIYLNNLPTAENDEQEATFGGDGGTTSFESDGTMHMEGDATVWDDISFPVTSVKRGATDKPDYDYTNIGLLFPQNDTAEKIYFTAQMSHRKKMNSPVHLHIHYIQSSATQPVFVAQYKSYDNGDAVPGAWTTIKTNDTGGKQGIFSYTSGSMLQIASFPEIVITDEGVSRNIDVILYRDDNVVTGDVLVKFVDMHFEMDTLGSRQEFVK